MLTELLAHTGAPLEPHDLWRAWSLEPLVVVGGAAAVWAYRRGRPAGRRPADDRWRAACFAGGVLALVVALVSPLDALSGALASAHMVQHVLLVLVAAPLLVLSAPSTALVRGAPVVLRRASGRWRRRLRLRVLTRWAARQPAAVWLLHVGALWMWHSAWLYDAAVEHEALHALEHASFLATAVAFWYLVVGRRAADRASHGAGVLLLFTMGMQSVFLSLLLTFAPSPWYSSYADTTAAWGLDPLADQQLAGVIMWVPAGAVYVGAAIALTMAWLRESERGAPAL